MLCMECVRVVIGVYNVCVVIGVYNVCVVIGVYNVCVVSLIGACIMCVLSC